LKNREKDGAMRKANNYAGDAP